MPDLSRRGFLGAAAAVTGAAVVGTTAAPAASAAEVAEGEHGKQHGHHGDIRDIKHVMIVMRENRSFDHHFGSTRGVRGFADRSIITLPGGMPVFQQPTAPPGSPGTANRYSA
ncbi:MAG TPA: alkaline phosphatase family protein [Pseudonocardiaceae bacterium]|nr:alkaline phosphatase family protein [Pseudonocardiaceae bacterium]